MSGQWVGPLEGVEDVPGLEDALALLQAAATAATDSELAAAVATLTTAIGTKQDASTAATDAEVASAIATVNAAMATDAELASAVVTVNAALAALDTRATALEAIPQDLDLQSFRSLDLWSAFDWTANTTYAAYIASFEAEIAAEILAGTVVKTDRGAATGPSDPPPPRIYSYRAGTGRRRVVLTSGTHPHEQIGMAASRQFFVQFAKSSDPYMRLLRTLVEIEYVPVVNPGAFRLTNPGGTPSGTNVNGINPEYNYAHFFPLMPADVPAYPSTNRVKGTAAFDQAESQAVKAVVDAGRTGCLIDCHDLDQPASNVLGAGVNPELIYIPPSTFHQSHRAVTFAAVEQWHEVYDDGTMSSRDLFATNDTGMPITSNWASWYLQHSKGRPNGAAVTVETGGDLKGSTRSTTTAAAVRLYAGFIGIFLARWLLDAQGAPPASPTTTLARRLADTAALTASNLAIVWDSGIEPNRGATTALDVVRFVVPTPGITYLTVHGFIRGGTVSDRVEVWFEVDGVDRLAQSVGSSTTIANGDVPFVAFDHFTTASLDASTVKAIRVYAKRASGTGAPVVRRCRLEVRHAPHNQARQGIPIVNPVPTVP